MSFEYEQCAIRHASVTWKPLSAFAPPHAPIIPVHTSDFECIANGGDFVIRRRKHRSRLFIILLVTCVL